VRCDGLQRCAAACPGCAVGWRRECSGSFRLFRRCGFFGHYDRCERRQWISNRRRAGNIANGVLYVDDRGIDHSNAAVAYEPELGAESLLRQRNDGDGVAGDASALAR
jgi:hypothetical protein